MRARTLSDLLRKGYRVAVSNITGREASRTSVVSQAYANNIVGGWALGKGGQKIECPHCRISTHSVPQRPSRLVGSR